ncbi:MAG: ABC transporter ATP-binding protein [Cytophagales bacterium]|nr:ABC transporter ATP-binding protein [Cytophagales bacterium]
MAKSKVTMGHVFKTIIWPRRKTVFIGLFLIIIGRLSGFVLPMSTKYLIDDVIDQGDSEFLKLIAVVVMIAVTIQAITSFLQTKLLSVEAQHLIAQLRVRVQNKIIYLPIRFFDNSRSGELVSRIMSDVEGVRNLVGTGLVQLVGGTLTALLSVFLLVNISPILTVVALIPMAIFGVISWKVMGTIRPVFRERGKINAEVTGRLTETLNGVRVIKGFNAEKQEVKVFENGVEKLFENIKRTLTATATMGSSGAFLIGLATVSVLGLGAYLIIGGDDALTKGDLIQFMFLVAFMIAPILQMGNIGTQLTEAFAGLDRTEEIMNMQEEDDPSVRTVALKDIKGDIKFQDVSFAYEEDKEVIHDINLEAPAGSVTALVGSSGSGKSTIAGLAASFLMPEKGLLTIDGQDISKVPLNSYRENLGVVLQDDFLFEGTIRENILFPRPDATEDQLMDAVKAAHVNEFTERFEEGLDTLIGERGVKLSGGQRQRLAIARAILADPRILILDEATSNLDTESESYIQQSLSRLMEGRTTFVIAHRLSTIRQADQILVIEKGKIVERGTHDELIAAEGRYYQLYTYQAKI